VTPKQHRPDPVLITEAEPSLDDQLRSRRRKYLVMMGIRACCLVLAAVFYQVPVAMAAFVVAAVALPWMAVLIANDRPPRTTWRMRRFRGHPAPERAIEAAPERSRVIEG
jgi:Flp pilus assembly protein TadB